MPHSVKSTLDIASNNAYFFTSVYRCIPSLCEDGEKVGGAMMWSEAKLSARDQLIVEQVILKLLVDRRFHHLANDAQQGNWPVLSWIRLGISLVNWDDRGSLPLVWESTI